MLCRRATPFVICTNAGNYAVLLIEKMDGENAHSLKAPLHVRCLLIMVFCCLLLCHSTHTDSSSRISALKAITLLLIAAAVGVTTAAIHDAYY